MWVSIGVPTCTGLTDNAGQRFANLQSSAVFTAFARHGRWQFPWSNVMAKPTVNQSLIVRRLRARTDYLSLRWFGVTLQVLSSARDRKGRGVCLPSLRRTFSYQ